MMTSLVTTRSVDGGVIRLARQPGDYRFRRKAIKAEKGRRFAMACGVTGER